jgi:hypothetical protein
VPTIGRVLHIVGLNVLLEYVKTNVPNMVACLN